MSVVDQIAFTSKSPRRIISAVRLSPRVVNQVRNLPATEGMRTDESQGAAGLLFGTAEQDLLRVEASRAFPAASGSSTREAMDTAFDRSFALAKADPELTSLQLVGWYSIRRPGNTAPLSDQEIEFHNRHFRRATDLALIVNAKQGPSASVDSIDLYSRSSSNAVVSWQDHRSGSFVLSSGSQVSTSSDIALRDTVNSDHYLKVFQVLDSLDRAEKKEGWKRIALRLKRITPLTLRPEWMKDQPTPPARLKSLEVPGSPTQAKPQTSASPVVSTNLAGAEAPLPQIRSTGARPVQASLNPGSTNPGSTNPGSTNPRSVSPGCTNPSPVNAPKIALACIHGINRPCGRRRSFLALCPPDAVCPAG